MNTAHRLFSAARNINDMMIAAGSANATRIILADDNAVSLTADGKITNFLETKVLRVWKRKTPQTGADLLWTANAALPVVDARGSKAVDALKANGVDAEHLAAFIEHQAAHAPFAVR